MGQLQLVRSGHRAISFCFSWLRGPSYRLPVLIGFVLMAYSSLWAQGSAVNCSNSIFGNALCAPGTDPANSSTAQQGTELQVPQQNQPQSQRPDNTQVYVDSGGNRWDRTTPGTDRNQSTFPPDPVTDIQKLAHSSTGEMVPVFGRDLFQRAPSTFAPADEVPVTPDYVIGPGDEILVRMWGPEQVSGNSQLTVDTSGNIYVPRVGAVQVAGLRSSELQDRITTEVNRTFRNYHLAVSLGHLRSIQVYVVGEARKPGAYTISALSTVLNALFVSGGPSVQGSMRHIQVRRGSRTLTDLDLYELILHGDKSHDVRLETGDTLFIPPVGPQVALAGSVRHPAIYELKDDGTAQGSSSLQDLLILAGGLSPTANPQLIRLERIDSSLRRLAMNISLDSAGRAMTLRDGDILYANHMETGFEKTVTIRGNLANPGRFAWHPGMRLTDIIPDRGALLTGDYWRERNRMGVPTPLFEPYEFNTPLPVGGGVRVDSSMSHTDGLNPSGMAGSARDALTAVLPPSIPGQETSEQQAGLASGGVVSSSATALDRSATTEAANVRSSNNGSSQTTSITGSNDPNMSRTLNMAPGGQNRSEESVIATRTPTVIRIPAPDIDWSFAVIERLDQKTLKTTLVPFNLGRLVQEQDSTQNLELEPGDVVTILNQRDILVPQHDQTKFVRLEGEFAGAGVYSVQPGETLVDLVRRAGGLTPSAYLYGSSFQRESTRVFQQQRLDEYITQLSTDMDRQTAVRGASTSTGVSDPNALVLERNLIEQLRQLRATGRIVLEFNPENSQLESIPAIPLENGDVFRVPSRTNTVNVIGAVYGQNVFLYNPKRRLDDYLSLAGRPNQIADKGHAFIIRADGSIFSRERAKGVLSNHFDDSRIYPGDSIVIPQKQIRPDVTRRLLDYSQILSSFGLAAAAINVVH